ncbi:sugar ABC transporter permease [uncultured Sphaerochaeta sp.]|uniref:carbohydrate ABC transporter permease n=1 Tax=uncultured Sphaerochaeta sp. TaxID=886478 RepID=UPI002A0A85F0|nr:sugar ABC transporter permease [uncultured Sphaerochaeta sp.]
MKKAKFNGNFNQTLAPMLFLLPNLVIFLVFIIYPALQGLRLSFTHSGVFSETKFVGLANFKELAHDGVYWITFGNTLVFSIFTVIFLMITSLALALLLSRNVLKGEKGLRAVFYIPALISMIAVGISWRFILGDEMGLVNYLIKAAGNAPVPWLTDGRLAMASVIFVTVWAQSGYYMVMYIAGLQAIPRELYEAAEIDGAKKWQAFSKITLPMLRSTLLVVMVLATIQSFKAYELIVTMTKGGPGYATKFVVQQVYEVAFIEDRLGYASSMSIILMVVIGLFTLVQFKLTGKEQDYE